MALGIVPRSSSLRFDSHNVLPKLEEAPERPSLRDICLEPNHDFLVWSKLPAIQNSSIIGKLSRRELLVCELQFNLVKNEFQCNAELEELLSQTRKSLKWDDPVPIFNRRHYIMLLSRMKKYSDRICKDFERDWNTRNSVALNLNRVFDAIDFNLTSSYALTCVAYCETFHEIRCMYRRYGKKREEHVDTVFSPKLHAERTLLPFQRFTLLKSTLRKICEETENRSILLRCRNTLDIVTGMLDRCFEVLTSLHGPIYVANIDNILDFSSKLSSIRYKKYRTDSQCLPTPNHLNIPEITFDYVQSHVKEFGEIEKEIARLHERFDPDAIHSDDDFELICFKRSSLLFEQFPSAGSNDLDSDYEPIEFHERTNSIQPLIEGNNYNLYHLREPVKSVPEESDHEYEETSFSVPRSITSYHKLQWKNIKEVKANRLLDSMTTQNRLLQETKFEILTSEVTYLQHLLVAVTVFAESEQIKNILTEEEHGILFKNIINVKELSAKFVDDLSRLLEKDVFLTNISGTMETRLSEFSKVYIEYCGNHEKTYNTLLSLMNSNEKFKNIVTATELSPECNGNSLLSYLLLPLQRVTRYPLLYQSLVKYVSPSDPECKTHNGVLRRLNNLVKDCNNAVEKNDYQ